MLLDGIRSLFPAPKDVGAFFLNAIRFALVVRQCHYKALNAWMVFRAWAACFSVVIASFRSDVVDVAVGVISRDFGVVE
jgi:hypothetical protein